MNFQISKENTIILDRILKVTKTEYITFDSTSASLIIQLLSNDTSQYSIIKLDPSFFISISLNQSLLTIPFQKFYKPDMKVLTLKQLDCSSIISYEFEGMIYKRCIITVDKEPFDFEFNETEALKIEIKPMVAVLKNFRDKNLTLEIGDCFKLCSETQKIEFKNFTSTKQTRKFKIQTERLKHILSISDYFNEMVLCYGNDEQILNIIFRGAEIFVSTFFTTE